MRNSPGWIIFAGLMLLLDLYIFQILKLLTQNLGTRTRSGIHISFWIISAIAIILLFILPYANMNNVSRGVRSTVLAIIIGLFLTKLIASVFFLLDDMRRGIQWIAGKLFFENTEGEPVASSQKINRSVFLSWLGFAIGGGLFTSLMFGFSNKYNYQVKKLKLKFPNLPTSFRGLRIVQISDVHSGSFTDKMAVERGIDKILSLQPDLILFTGDLINNKAEEMHEYHDIFRKLNAPMGVYSILGNHDYGDYFNWPDEHAKRRNLEQLMEVHSSMGWKLMLDENILLERNEEKLALIGIQNWSALKNFAKYGNLRKAYAGTENIPFKILMSHDPTHWDAEVRKDFGDIDLTLAGHTHGMQFGVEIPGFRWSPVQYVYDQWAGLYEEGTQKLYVNRGFGFIGYPGRVGILPEITLLELS